jgi:hypothetical protein
MKNSLFLAVLAMSTAAFADPVTLSLPENATLTFDPPEMT